jgi:pimeloyl-ACP methyl ester carboxylesterase
VSSSSQLDVGGARRTELTGSFGKIAALQDGPADGAPVLLVPGYTGSKEDFGPILDRLAEAGLLATAIDLPGQFESPGPAEPAGYSVELLAREVRRVIEQLGGPVHLLGHSFGGLVTRAAVISDPSIASDLVLMSSGPAALGGARRDRIELMRPVLPSVGVDGLWDAMQAMFAAEPGYVAPPAAVQEFLHRRFVTGSEAMLQGMGDALTSEPDRVAELIATGVRTCVLYGVDDDAWPTEVQAEMASRLGAREVVLKDAAHSPAVENPEATAEALLDFWGMLDG